VTLALAIGVAAAWLTHQVVSSLDTRESAREHDMGLYRQLPIFPGSVLTTTYLRDFKRDTCSIFSCSTYRLVVEYQLPDLASAPEVLAFYTQHLSRDWQVADDSACSAVSAAPTVETIMKLRLPPNSVLLWRSRTDFVLLNVAGQLLSYGKFDWGCVAV
jgi:hypothetical protein